MIMKKIVIILKGGIVMGMDEGLSLTGGTASVIAGQVKRVIYCMVSLYISIEGCLFSAVWAGLFLGVAYCLHLVFPWF